MTSVETELSTRRTAYPDVTAALEVLTAPPPDAAAMQLETDEWPTVRRRATDRFAVYRAVHGTNRIPDRPAAPGPPVRP